MQKWSTVVATASMFLTLISVPTLAHEKTTPKPEAEVEVEAEIEELHPQSLIPSVVKVFNQSNDIFTAEKSNGHGSGFFVGIDKETGKGLIFTNEHVINKSELNVQRLAIEFPTSQRGEIIPAKILFVSQLHDFAVLEFDPKLLKRADLSRPLKIPDPESPLYDFVPNQLQLRGLDVVAIGNPFEGQNITTFGYVTGLYWDPGQGPYIQIDCPINPGNSGGPLIARETGEVIGINSMKRLNAEGTHWAIPIGVVMDEFNLWRKQVKSNDRYRINEPRELGVSLSSIGEDMAQMLGVYEPVGDYVKGYWDQYSSLLMVTDMEKGSVFKPNDIILEMDGRPVGGYPYDFYRRVASAGPQSIIKVLRNNEPVELSVEVKVDPYRRARINLDYVYISGLFLQEISSTMSRPMRSEMSTAVVVGRLIDSPDVSNRPNSYPWAGSIVKAVSFGGEEYEIKNLFDLKQAINKNRDKKTITMRVYKSNMMSDGQGNTMLIRSRSNGAPLLDGTTSVFVISMREVFTPMQFSIHRFMKQYDFSPRSPETRDWRTFVKKDRLPSHCEVLLGKKIQI